MSLNFTNVADTLPANTLFPGTPQGLLDLIAQYMSITGGETFITINFGSDTPDVDQRAFPWFKTDSNGVPIGWFSWNGSAWQQMPVTVLSGTTAQQPAGTAGMLYLDTDIRALLVYENSAWRTVDGTPGSVKFVRKCYAAGVLVDEPNLAQVLTANPGWSDFEAIAGRVPGAVGEGSGLTPRTLGQEVGAEEVVLTDAQLPAHAHSNPWAAYSGQHQNGIQPAGVYPVVTGTGSSDDSSVGDDEAHPNMQPTLFLFCLIKD